MTTTIPANAVKLSTENASALAYSFGLTDSTCGPDAYALPNGALLFAESGRVCSRITPANVRANRYAARYMPPRSNP